MKRVALFIFAVGSTLLVMAVPSVVVAGGTPAPAAPEPASFVVWGVLVAAGGTAYFIKQRTKKE